MLIKIRFFRIWNNDNNYHSLTKIWWNLNLAEFLWIIYGLSWTTLKSSSLVKRPKWSATFVFISLSIEFFHAQNCFRLARFKTRKSPVPTRLGRYLLSISFECLLKFRMTKFWLKIIFFDDSCLQSSWRQFSGKNDHCSAFSRPVLRSQTWIYFH